MKREEVYYPSADGKTQIHALLWLPDGTPRAILQLSHGISEYVERYEDFATFLCEQGFLVLGNDHLGHGKSIAEGAKPMHFGPKGSWDFVVQDIHSLYERIRTAFPTLPYALLGHSMGSFLARTFLITYPDAVDAAILMGTGQMPPALVRSGLVVARLCALQHGWEEPHELVDKLAFGAYNSAFAPNRTTHDWLSVNEKNVDAFLADPLCIRKPTVGTFREMLCGIRFITTQSNVEKMKNMPVLFIAGEKDPVGELGRGVERAAASFRAAGLTDVDVILYPELRHEILNEECNEIIYRTLLKWLNAHLFQ